MSELEEYIDDYCERLEGVLHDHLQAIYELGKLSTKGEIDE